MVLYAAAALLTSLQGNVLNRTTSAPCVSCAPPRKQPHRLPLAYYDGEPDGELLSRMTNDIDNATRMRRCWAKLERCSRCSAF